MGLTIGWLPKRGDASDISVDVLELYKPKPWLSCRIEIIGHVVTVDFLGLRLFWTQSFLRG
jgi:hypothetical protein